MKMPCLTEGYDWLRLLESSHLSEPTQLLVAEINRALAAGDSKRAYQIVDRLLLLCDALTDRMEKAEATLESGLAFYWLGDYEHAIERLEEARLLYRNNLHYTAVALWIEGCIQWELPQEHDKAYTAWSQCSAQFTILEKSSGNADHARWYAERAQQINEDIDKALKQEQQPVPPAQPDMAQPPAAGTQPDVAQAPTPGTQPEPFPGLEPTPVDPQVYLQLFRVVEEIPAGGFGPVGFRPFTIGEVDTDRVIIAGEPCRIAKLHGSGKVIALRSSSYVVLKVTGDSMNKPGRLGEEGINSGDFVLLHLQEAASDGDIVAVEIDDLDSQATLKRLRILQEGRQYMLEPQSTNPTHQPHTFSQMNAGFSVRGIVLVVFKPIHKAL